MGQENGIQSYRLQQTGRYSKLNNKKTSLPHTSTRFAFAIRPQQLTFIFQQYTNICSFCTSWTYFQYVGQHTLGQTGHTFRRTSKYFYMYFRTYYSKVQGAKYILDILQYVQDIMEILQDVQYVQYVLKYITFLPGIVVVNSSAITYYRDKTQLLQIKYMKYMTLLYRTVFKQQIKTISQLCAPFAVIATRLLSQ